MPRNRQDHKDPRPIVRKQMNFLRWLMDLQTATGIDVRKGILESCVGIEPLILEYRGSFHMHVNVVELGYAFMEGIA